MRRRHCVKFGLARRKVNPVRSRLVRICKRYR